MSKIADLVTTPYDTVGTQTSLFWEWTDVAISMTVIRMNIQLRITGVVVVAHDALDTGSGVWHVFEMQRFTERKTM